MGAYVSSDVLIFSGTHAGCHCRGPNVRLM